MVASEVGSDQIVNSNHDELYVDQSLIVALYFQSMFGE